MPYIKSIDDDFTFDKYMGLKIVLDNDEEIIVGIEEFQSCCEVYGYYMEYPDGYNTLHDCIGLQIIDFTDGSSHRRCSYISYTESGKYSNNLTININTTAGVISCTLYNEHNGYYPHDIYMEFNDYTDKQTL